MLKLNYEEGSFKHRLNEELKLAKIMLATDIQKLEDQINCVFSRHHQLSFDYTDPVPNFDRKKVFGPLCLQMEIKDPKYCIALDIIAGEKLYEIIVNDEVTRKLILDKGQLKRRCTMIALNNIQGYCTDTRTASEAELLVGKGNVVPALSCVAFDEQLTPAMEYAFGNYFICANMKIAAKVAFHPGMQGKFITLEGDVYDPEGTISGGYIENVGQVLESCYTVTSLKKTIAKKNIILNEIEARIQQLRRIKEK